MPLCSYYYHIQSLQDAFLSQQFYSPMFCRFAWSYSRVLSHLLFMLFTVYDKKYNVTENKNQVKI